MSCVWLFLLSIMLSSFIHIITYISSFFMVKKCSIIWLYHICLSIHQMMDICIISTFCLLHIILLWTYVYVSVWTHFFYFVIYLQMELPSYIIAIYTSKVPTHFFQSGFKLCIPTNNVWRLLVPYILTNTCYYLFFYYYHFSKC